MYALILAGGKGERLGDYTKDTPKPMVLVDGKPMIERQIEHLKQYDTSNFVIATGFQAHKIRDYFQDGSKFGVNIKYVDAPLDIGAGGGAKLGLSTMPAHEKNVFILAGDILSDIDFTALLESHRKAWTDGFIPIITPVGLPGRYGSFHVEGQFSSQTEKDPISGGGWCVDREWFLKVAPKQGGFDFITGLPFGDIGKPYMHTGFWRDVGYPQDLEEVNNIYKLKRELESRGSRGPEKG